MAGETWQQVFQVGKETVEGTGVAATRKMYWTGEAERVRIVLSELHEVKEFVERLEALDSLNG